MELAHLKSVLFGLVSNYQSLLRLLQRERESLVECNAEQVSLLAREKDTVVLRLQLLEEEKRRIMQVCASESAIEEPFTLGMLCQMTDDEELENFALQLVSLTQSITELNSFNKLIAERSACVATYALGLLNSLGVKPEPVGVTPRVAREI